MSGTKCYTGGGLFNQICVPTGGTPLDIISGIVTFLLALAAALAVLFIIIGGVRYIISGGDSDQTESAKQTIVHSIIGLIVIILSFVILNTVKALFHG